MSTPHDPEDVKAITSVFSADESLIGAVMEELQHLFGPLDWKSPVLLFNRTKYYTREMGWPLYRRFVSFRQLMKPETLVAMKLATNRVETDYLADGKRKVNIDPGYISLERLVLATGKNYTHRIYLSHGIYADLTLVFHKNCFRPLPWTYPDYADQQVIAYLNEEREYYKKQLRGILIPSEQTRL